MVCIAVVDGDDLRTISFTCAILSVKSIDTDLVGIAMYRQNVGMLWFSVSVAYVEKKVEHAHCWKSSLDERGVVIDELLKCLGSHLSYDFSFEASSVVCSSPVLLLPVLVCGSAIHSSLVSRIESSTLGR